MAKTSDIVMVGLVFSAVYLVSGLLKPGEGKTAQETGQQIGQGAFGVGLGLGEGLFGAGQGIGEGLKGFWEGMFAKKPGNLIDDSLSSYDKQKEIFEFSKKIHGSDSILPFSSVPLSQLRSVAGGSVVGLTDSYGKVWTGPAPVGPSMPQNLKFVGTGMNVKIGQNYHRVGL